MSVRNAILIFLDSGPDHGFALKKRFEESTAELWSLNVGQVYSTLQRLERDGLVREVDSQAEDSHSTNENSHGGAEASSVGDDTPSQRRYEITDAGRGEVESWIQHPQERTIPDRDDLIIKLAALAAVGHPGLTELIDAQRSATTQALQQFTRVKASIHENDTAQLLSIDAVIFQIEAELRWLNHIQARLERQL